MHSDKFIELCTLILSNEANAAEKDTFHQLIEDEKYLHLYEELKSHWDNIKPIPQDRQVFESVLGKVTQGIQEVEPEFSFKQGKPTPVITISPRMWQIAASVLILTCFSLLLYTNQDKLFGKKEANLEWIQKQTKPGQRVSIPLADGSKVLLGPGSKIRYPKKFAEDERRVVLEGEAFFEVERNITKPFIVKSPKSETRVLGTKFNVNDFEKDSLAQVALVEGIVEVASIGNSSEKQYKQLSPQEIWSFNANNESQEIDKFNYDQVVGWKDNVYAFDDLPFAQAIPILERHFGVKFQLENKAIGNCRLTGSFDSEATTSVISGILYTLNIKYEKNGKQLLLKGKGCTL